MHDVINCLLIGDSNYRNNSKNVKESDVMYSMTHYFYIEQCSMQ